MQDDKPFQERLQRVETFLETEDGYIGLSEPVEAAVDEAIAMIKLLVEKIS